MTDTRTRAPFPAPASPAEPPRSAQRAENPSRSRRAGRGADRRFLAALVAAALLLAAGSAAAAERTVTLAVNGMTCPACPFIVERALTRVDGVVRVEVSFFSRKAEVVFDDGKTDVSALTAATAAAGFPSRLLETAER